MSLGTRSSESTTETHSSKAAGSAISSGGNTVINASGDGTAGSGDLTIIGSTVNAGGTATLVAANDINLLSAEDISTAESERENYNASVGAKVSVGSNGWGISIEAGLGLGDGESASKTVTHNETIISGGTGVNFASGNDTTLKGAQIHGETVVGQVGGDLNIVSEQDTMEAYQKSQDMSASVSIPVYGANTGSASFNYSSQDAESSYKSVKEQSGIMAGEGGFDITTRGGG